MPTVKGAGRDAENSGEILSIQELKLVETAREFASLYSPEINSIMKGMTETSGLNEDEVMVLNAGMILLTIQILSGEPPSACSGLAAWNEYTPDGSLVFGRNWDIHRESMVDYMEFLGIVVFHSSDGLAVANIHPIGNLYLETGMNERGIFLELNNGEQSDSNFNEEAEDSSSVLLRDLSSCSSLNDAVEMLFAEPADVSYIIQVADSSKAVSVERATFGDRVREGIDSGLLAAYNSFVPFNNFNPFDNLRNKI